MKKEKQKTPELILGKRIREIKINEKQHFLLFVVLLVTFNLLLLGSIWFLLLNLKSWYNWLFSIIILAVCGFYSFKTYVNRKTFHKCELYDNALVVNSIWFDLSVGLQDICDIRVKKSFLDKMFKQNTKSMEIKILNRNRKKFTLHFIEEDANELRFEILKLIENNSKKKKK